ncbi:MAG: hypothetical protein U9O94_05975 [Nanoarchaeota archaeon]|nr:hypothetical protein [Nanoarchaeota archaeon]
MNIDKIKKFVKEYKEQDNRITSFPYMFILQERYTVAVSDDYADSNCMVEYINVDDEIFLSEEEYKELFANSEIDEDGQEVAFDEDGELLYKDEFKEVCSNFYWKDVGFFFTEKALNEHVEANHYHYGMTRSYVKKLFRNPEMEMILKTMFEIAG